MENEYASPARKKHIKKRKEHYGKNARTSRKQTPGRHSWRTDSTHGQVPAAIHVAIAGTQVSQDTNRYLRCATKISGIRNTRHGPFQSCQLHTASGSGSTAVGYMHQHAVLFKLNKVLYGRNSVKGPMTTSQDAGWLVRSQYKSALQCPDKLEGRSAASDTNTNTDRRQEVQGRQAKSSIQCRRSVGGIAHIVWKVTFDCNNSYGKERDINLPKQTPKEK